MRTSRRGSRLQPALRATRAVVPLTLTVAMGLTVPAPAGADPESNSISALVADVAEANQHLDDVAALASRHGFKAPERIPMPANNLSLVFRRG